MNAEMLRTLHNITTADEEDDDDHVDISEITPYASPGELLKNMPKQNQGPLGGTQVADSTKGKTANPYDNVPDEEPDRSEDEKAYKNGEI